MESASPLDEAPQFAWTETATSETRGHHSGEIFLGDFNSNGLFELTILGLQEVIENFAFIKIFSNIKQIFQDIVIVFPSPNSQAVPVIKMQQNCKVKNDR